MTITNVKAAAPAGASASCYQAIIIQGPVAADYNGLTQPPPTVYPVQNVTIADCDFGTPANTAQPYYLYNVGADPGQYHDRRNGLQYQIVGVIRCGSRRRCRFGPG